VIIADPREIALWRTPHIEATSICSSSPAPTWRCSTHSPTGGDEGSFQGAYVGRALSRSRLPSGRRSWPRSAIRRRPRKRSPACRGGVRRAARLYAPAAIAPIYYGLGVTRQPGHHRRHGDRQPRHATGNLGREGGGVNPLRGQNNVQGSCDMGSSPTSSAPTATCPDPVVRASFEAAWGVPLQAEPACVSEHVRGRLDGTFRGMYVQARTSCSPVPPKHCAPVTRRHEASLEDENRAGNQRVGVPRLFRQIPVRWDGTPRRRAALTGAVSPSARTARSPRPDVHA